jgi:DNA-binding NarL/FixJ family response regulator
MKRSDAQSENARAPIRVLLVDDQILFCDMLVPNLDARGFKVVAVAHTTGEALAHIREREFDLAIVDIELSEHDTQGLSLVPHIRRHQPQARVAIFSMHLSKPGIDLVRRAQELDVEGILLKNGHVDEVCAAMRMIVENPGFLYRDPALRVTPPSAAVRALKPVELAFIRDYARRPMERRVWATEHGESVRFFDNRMNAIIKKILELDLWPNGDTRTELSRLEVYQWARDRGLHFE